MEKRINVLKSILKTIGVDAFLVTDPANLFYLSGYTGSNGMLIVRNNQSKPIFYTDFRYQEQIKTEVKDCQKVIWDRNLYEDFPVKDLSGIKSLGFESYSVTYANFLDIKRQLKSRIKLVPTYQIVGNLRMKKDNNEIKKIRKAVYYTDKVFADILKIIKPGVSEKDLVREIDYQFTKYGDIAFSTIVAFAERGALPHAQPTNKKLKKGDVIVFDIGLKYEHYCSDMTRTVVMGKASSKVKKIYNIVLTAQRLAQEKIIRGKLARDIDRISRNFISSKGYGMYFGHGLGHGVGLMVHEMPVISSKSNDVLNINQVFSVEPGIYLPNEFGVRIEDLVVVKEKSCEILTKSPKELIEL
jgi:Xaa-Pro aminopeptidase